jgi:hypothetical protein
MRTSVRRALTLSPPAPVGHHLVNLVVRGVEPVAQRDGETWRTLVRIRAVTELV